MVSPLSRVILEINPLLTTVETIPQVQKTDGKTERIEVEMKL